MASNSEKSANSFMPLYGGDYLRDTMHHTAAHDGIYFRLLMHYWHTQKPLPNSRVKLEGIARCRDDAERAVLTDILRDYFPEDGDVRRNKRMDHEIEVAAQIQIEASERGRRGGLASAQRRKQQSDASTAVERASNTRSTLVQRPSTPPPPPPPPPIPPPVGGSASPQPPLLSRGSKKKPEHRRGKGKQADDQELRKQAEEIVAFLNARAGKTFDVNGANAEHVFDRLRDGESPDDCRAVIAMKVREWRNDPKFSKFLRPETLFDRTKFASYKGELKPTQRS